MSDALARAAEVLSGADEVAIACHVNPDTDALGATLGLSLFLRSRGVRTVCSFPNDPFELPRWAQELPGTESLVEPSAFPNAPAVMVTCDVASMDRLAMLARIPAPLRLTAAGTATLAQLVVAPPCAASTAWFRRTVSAIDSHLAR